MIYIIDTHALVWFLAGDAKLSSKAQQILGDPGQGNRLAVPTIVLAEAWDLARKKKVSVPFTDVLRAVRASRALLLPLELNIINLFPGLLPDIHDEIIIATALDLQLNYDNVSIVTKDQKIQNSNVVTCIW
jgi:PIN domain nuclease of toxin-antitoxin system